MKRFVEEYLQQHKYSDVISEVIEREKLKPYNNTVVDNKFTQGRIERVVKDEYDTWVALELDNDCLIVAMHERDCCEDVFITDYGDIENSVGEELLSVDWVTNKDLEPIEKMRDTYTWTFVNARTKKDVYQVRFFGTSNGYYAEDARWYYVRGVSAHLQALAILNKQVFTTFLNSRVEVSIQFHERYHQWAVCIGESEFSGDKEPRNIVSLFPSAEYDKALASHDRIVNCLEQIGLVKK